MDLVTTINENLPPEKISVVLLNRFDAMKEEQDILSKRKILEFNEWGVKLERKGSNIFWKLSHTNNGSL